MPFRVWSLTIFIYVLFRVDDIKNIAEYVILDLIGLLLRLIACGILFVKAIRITKKIPYIFNSKRVIAIKKEKKNFFLDQFRHFSYSFSMQGDLCIAPRTNTFKFK